MKQLSLWLIFGLLGGCSSYSNKFDCPYGEGVGCASLSRVNKMVDRHQIDLDEEGEIPIKKKEVHIFFGPDQISKLVSIQEPIVD